MQIPLTDLSFRLIKIRMAQLKYVTQVIYIKM